MYGKICMNTSYSMLWRSTRVRRVPTNLTATYRIHMLLLGKLQWKTNLAILWVGMKHVTCWFARLKSYHFHLHYPTLTSSNKSVQGSRTVYNISNPQSPTEVVVANAAAAERRSNSHSCGEKKNVAKPHVLHPQCVYPWLPSGIFLHSGTPPFCVGTSSN